MDDMNSLFLTISVKKEKWVGGFYSVGDKLWFNWVCAIVRVFLPISGIDSEVSGIF